MVVYVDIILIENLIMNYAILYTTFFIKKIKVSKIRILISAIIGAIYTIIIFVPKIGKFNNIISKILLSCAMIRVIHKERRLKNFIELLLMFYLTSFTIGGLTFAISFLKHGQIYSYNNSLIIEFPVISSIVALFIGIFLIKNVFKNIKNLIKKDDIFYQLEIYIEKKKSSINAILDTGNMLKDPITKTPVIIVNKNSIKNILPQELLYNIETILGGDCLGKLNNEKIAKRITIIPYTSLGNENGMILGVKPDKIKIEGKVIRNVVIGVYDKELSKRKKYDALFGLDLLKGGV